MAYITKKKKKKDDGLHFIELIACEDNTSNNDVPWSKFPSFHPWLIPDSQMEHLLPLQLHQIPNPPFFLPHPFGSLRNLPGFRPGNPVPSRVSVRKTGWVFDIHSPQRKLVGLAGAPGRRRGADGGDARSPANVGVGRRWETGRVCGGWVPCNRCCECELQQLLITILKQRKVLFFFC